MATIYPSQCIFLSSGVVEGEKREKTLQQKRESSRSRKDRETLRGGSGGLLDEKFTFNDDRSIRASSSTTVYADLNCSSVETEENSSSFS